MKDYSANSLPPWGFPHGALLAPGHTLDTTSVLPETFRSACPLTKQTRYLLEKLSTEEPGQALQLWKDGWEPTMSYCLGVPTPSRWFAYSGIPLQKYCKPTTSKKPNKEQGTYEAQAAARDDVQDGATTETKYKDPEGHYLFRTYWGEGK